jgi:hypothetical protein
MKLLKRSLFIILLIGVSTACQRRITRDSIEFFDLGSFIDRQVDLLTEGSFELKKKTLIGDSMEILVLLPDSLGWDKELSIFKTADIHKPGLRELYEKTIRETDSFKIENYALSDTTESETIQLSIRKDKRTEHIRSIDAVQHTTNPIYNSRRNLHMMFRSGKEGKILLDSFTVRGFQKMILQDSVTYFTAGKIKLPE